MLELLPAGLRGHVSLRNVEAVVSLSPQAQTRLAEAIRSGLKRLPGAIEQLRINPNASVGELLNPAPRPASTEPTVFLHQTQEELTNLIQLCFPDMPRVSAEALAGADVMEIARQTAQAYQDVFASRYLRTDFVIMVLYVLVRQAMERLDEIIAESPALQQAFRQSALPWKTNDWSKQDAQKNR